MVGDAEQKSACFGWQSYILKTWTTITQEFSPNSWKALPKSCAWVSSSVQGR